MASLGGPNIITNGLVLQLDAANAKSYPGSGTVWRDLSRNNNSGSLVNGPTFSNVNGGNLIFVSSSNQYVQTAYMSQLNDFSVCSWFRNTSSTSYARIMDKNFQSGFWLGQNGLSPNQWGGGVRQTSNYGFVTLSNVDWHYIVMTRTGTSSTIYGDGITNTNTFICGSGTTDTTILSLGGTINDGAGQRDWYSGSIALVQIYNRALSATEVAQNFNATKARFNL
jgi:hypothetical protein